MFVIVNEFPGHFGVPLFIPHISTKSPNPPTSGMFLEKLGVIKEMGELELPSTMPSSIDVSKASLLRAFATPTLRLVETCCSYSCRCLRVASSLP